MREHIISSLKYSAGYTALLISLAVYETLDRGRSIKPDEFILATLMVFATSSLAIIYLHYVLKLHLAMKNLGWKRLLLVASLLTAPVAIYIGYEIEYVNRITEHFITISFAIGAAYASVMSLFIGCKWVADGFKQ